MQSRPHSGGVTAKRSTVAFAGVLALAILAVLLKAPNRQGVTRQHPLSPSAAEESGISEPVATVESRVWSAPEDIRRPRPQIPRGHQAASKGRDHHLTSSATRHDPSIREEARIVGDSSVSPGGLSRSGVLLSHNVESKLGGEARVEEGQVTVSVVSSGPQVTARIPLLTPPVPLSVGSLRYPAEGYRLVVDHSAVAPGIGIDAAEGRVGLKILVRADGSVGWVEVVQSSGRSFLDVAAVREVRLWKFVPATRDGHAIDAWALVPLLFVLR